MKYRARLGAAVDCARAKVWWTKARRQRLWARTAVAALAVDSDVAGGPDTNGRKHPRGSGH